MSCMHCFTGITKIGFILTLAQQLLSCSTFYCQNDRKKPISPWSIDFCQEKLKRREGICIGWPPIRLGRPGLVMISKTRGSGFPLLGCYKKLLQKLVKSFCGKKSRARQKVWVIRAKLVLRRIVCIKCIKCISSIQCVRCTGCKKKNCNTPRS
jgi:hypothetical protein